jgi:hypothetical protein
MPQNSHGITPPNHSFAGLPVCTRLENLEADIAIIGIHYVSPYPQLATAAASPSAVDTAPDAIRLQSSVFIDHWDHYDFDFNKEQREIPSLGKLQQDISADHIIAEVARAGQVQTEELLDRKTRLKELQRMAMELSASTCKHCHFCPSCYQKRVVEFANGCSKTY